MERDIPKGIVLDERHDPTHPLVRGRTKPVFWVSTVDGIDLVENPAHQQGLDQVDARSVTAMSGRE